MRNCGSVPKPSNCLAVYRLHERSILTEKEKKLLRLGYVYVTRHAQNIYIFLLILIFFIDQILSHKIYIHSELLPNLVLM